MNKPSSYRNTSSPIPRDEFLDLGKTFSSPQAMNMADHLRIRVVEFYHSKAGREWSSGGRAETDYLHHVNLTVNGSARIIHPQGCLEMVSGQVYWIPGNIPVIRECDDHLEIYAITFRFEWLGGLDPFTEWAGRRPVCLGPWAGSFFSEYVNLQRGLSTLEAWQMRAQLAIWLAPELGDLETIISASAHNSERFRPMLEHFETTIGADVRIEDLARKIGLSGRAFSMAFTRALGVNPKTYVSRRLNQEAIRQVIQPGATMKEIAARLRFSDEYHFNRFFKKMNGIPPMRFRQNYASGHAAFLRSPERQSC